MNETIARAALPRRLLLITRNSQAVVEDLLKATSTKTILVPGYKRADGTWVPPHQKKVHYDPSKSAADILAGKGSHSQKQALKKLSKLSHWEQLLEDDKLAHVLSSATNIQQKASASAAVSGWKSAMLAGKKPTASQQAAFDALPKAKQAELLAQVGGSAPAAPVAEASKPEASAPKLGLVGISLKEAIEAEEKASAAEKVKQATAAATASMANEPSFQEAAAIAAEKTAGDAASKLAMIPWDSQLLPESNTNAKSHNGQVAKIKAMAEAGDVAGLQAYVDAKAGAKQTYAKKQHLLAATALAALKEGGAPAPAASGTSMAGKPAYDMVALAVKKGMAPKDAAAQWLAANAGEEVELSEALIALGHDKVAADMDLPAPGLEDDEPEPAPAATVAVDATVFHNTQPGHNKFWSVSVHGTTMKTVYGKIGTTGQSTTKTFESQAAAYAAAAKLMKEKEAKGYEYAGTMKVEHSVADQGPKEGDVKQGADGLLVLKDGHWVKMAEPDSAAWSFTANDPGFSGASTLTADADGMVLYVAYDPHEGVFEAGLMDAESGEPDSQTFTDPKKVIDYLHATIGGSKELPSLAQVEKLTGKVSGQSYSPKQDDQHPLDAVPMPDISSATNKKWKSLIVMSLNALKEQAKKYPSVLNDVAKEVSSGKYIFTLPNYQPGYAGQMKYNGTGEASKNVYDYIEALKAAAATASSQADPSGIVSMDGWVQTGGQGGSNPGGKFKDHNGVEWYCKFPADEDTAKAEVLAAKLYALAGLSSQDAKLVTKGGKVGIASKWIDVKKGTAAQLAKLEGTHSGFAVDAWLGNWDVVGLGYDNLQIGPDGKAHRVDAGGSLMYRAQGGKKAFGPHVGEIDSLRDKSINPQAAAVFGKMSQADITASVAKVLAIPDVSIRMLVEQHGPGDAAAKKALADTLIARKADLAAKYPKAVKKKKAPVFKPEKISAPPSFMNWGGSGKPGPSSKPFLNEANEQAVQAIFAAAKTGSVEAVQKLTAPTFNKDTGEVIGQAPVLEHPSQHVKGYAQQAINEINYQLNPPKRFRFEGGHPLHALNSAYPSYKGPAHGANIQKVAKFLLLGEPGTVNVESLGLPKATYQAGTLSRATYSPAAKAAIAKMPATQREAIKAYTGPSYKSMNSSLWSGNPTGAAKAAGEALHTLGHDIAPGTVLSRKLSIHGSDLDLLLKSTGKVLQEPAIMSTSIRPSSWGGNVQLKLHVGPGVKGLWVGIGSLGGQSALSVNKHEDELILPPNTRILITSVKKSAGLDADGFGGGVDHVIEAIVLPSMG